MIRYDLGKLLYIRVLKNSLTAQINFTCGELVKAGRL